jgi:dihydrofolate reductase
MSIKMILAMDDSFGIGKDNAIPWDSKEDMKFFKKTTTNYPVVMGSRTARSLPFPLPNRRNWFLSRSNYKREGFQRKQFDDILRMGKAHDLFIIGGKVLYEDFLPHCDTIYVTRIEGHYDCDTTLSKDFLRSLNTDFEPEFLKEIPEGKIWILRKKVA